MLYEGCIQNTNVNSIKIYFSSNRSGSSSLAIVVVAGVEAQIGVVLVVAVATSLVIAVIVGVVLVVVVAAVTVIVAAEVVVLEW